MTREHINFEKMLSMQTSTKSH